MTIPIRQSELNASGFAGNFPMLSWSERRDTATQTLLRLGRSREAMLLEINNPNAIRGITYINDTPLRTR